MFDYVIVGAGSAGCVLAARLSEEPDCRVLLLEAGPPDDAAQIRIPAVAPSLWKGPFAWDDATIPQRHAAARRIHWPSGFTLGGSSSINGMIHIRGNRVDYDGWRDAYGCAGWGHADLLPYFQRAEEQLGVEHVRDPHPLTRAWVEAAKAYGLPANDDFNGPEQEGVGFYRVTQRDGGRWSAADAYLRPALRRPNLTVETGALVTAVRVEDGRAAGVRYVRAGGEREARARREVVLSGGTVHSPQLLMLSGIGPAEHLREHGIDAIVDAPGVGRGLQDHPLAGVVWRTPDARNLSEDATPENLALWERERRGPMASSPVAAGGFARTRANLDAPDLQYGVIPGPGTDQDMVPRDWRGMTVIFTVLDARSRGRLLLRSADPGERPAIDPAYLADEADLDGLVAGLGLAREIAGHEPLAGLVAGEFEPGPDADDREWIRGNVMSTFHPTSTCAMGGSDEAVCDPELRVRGVEALRVVDASVMPALPHGNTNAPTLAIAERAADLVRGAATAERRRQAAVS